MRSLGVSLHVSHNYRKPSYARTNVCCAGSRELARRQAEPARTNVRYASPEAESIELEHEEGRESIELEHEERRVTGRIGTLDEGDAVTFRVETSESLIACSCRSARSLILVPSG